MAAGGADEAVGPAPGGEMPGTGGFIGKARLEGGAGHGAVIVPAAGHDGTLHEHAADAHQKLNISSNRAQRDRPFPDMDLVIDCTASLAVRTALERALRGVGTRPAIASLAIDSQAGSAIATLSTSNHNGGTLDLVRRLKLEACRKPGLSKMLESFWPRSSSGERFQPEPGCSEPTFISSNADLAGLSARMLNSVARATAKPGDCQTGAGWLLEESGPVHAFAWHSDHVLRDR